MALYIHNNFKCRLNYLNGGKQENANNIKLITANGTEKTCHNLICHYRLPLFAEI